MGLFILRQALHGIKQGVIFLSISSSVCLVVLFSCGFSLLYVSFDNVYCVDIRDLCFRVVCFFCIFGCLVNRKSDYFSRWFIIYCSRFAFKSFSVQLFLFYNSSPFVSDFYLLLFSVCDCFGVVTSVCYWSFSSFSILSFSLIFQFIMMKL